MGLDPASSLRYSELDVRARVVADRLRIVDWLRRMADEGGDPWMEFVADELLRSAHLQGPK